MFLSILSLLSQFLSSTERERIGYRGRQASMLICSHRHTTMQADRQTSIQIGLWMYLYVDPGHLKLSGWDGCYCWLHWWRNESIKVIDSGAFIENKGIFSHILKYKFRLSLIQIIWVLTPKFDFLIIKWCVSMLFVQVFE